MTGDFCGPLIPEKNEPDETCQQQNRDRAPHKLCSPFGSPLFLQGLSACFSPLLKALTSLLVGI